VNQRPLISVILPVYNAEKYVGDALQSILDQTVPEFELLVIDDGSTDHSPKILRDFERSDDRVHLTVRPNRGLVTTLNELIASATGTYLARMDADDISLPDRFEKQVEFLTKRTDVAVVGGQAELIDDVGRVIGPFGFPHQHSQIDSLLAEGHCTICHPAAMMRLDKVNKIGGYDASLGAAEDLDLWLRLGEIGQLANLPDTVIRYRIHSGSISGANRELQRAFAKTVQQMACKRRGTDVEFTADAHWRPGTSRKSRQSFAAKYAWLAFNHQHLDTFRHYAWQAIRLRPFSTTSLRLSRAWMKIR
tara:strand:- start:347 stop:1261 length:915 start_codon:yes stop_codon:yes gene_type:complete